jgi:histone H3/H4
MPDLPVAPLSRLMKKAGAHRVSDSAAEELRDVLEEKAYEIARRAIKLSEHAGRVTLTRDDIKLAK